MGPQSHTPEAGTGFTAIRTTGDDFAAVQQLRRDRAARDVSECLGVRQGLTAVSRKLSASSRSTTDVKASQKLRLSR